ncbi:MAG: DUF21 domain-containing protein [Planctomycetes bacterium]|nr:DUF21 domain-containing protein [Planctomycetota bacterium]
MIPILLLVLFFGGAVFFQACELAIVAHNRIRVRHILRGGHPYGPAMVRVSQNPEAYLTATLVGTNISVVGASSVATYLAEEWLAVPLRPVFLLAVTLLFLFFGEILPKGLVRRRPTYFLLHTVGLLHAAYVVLWPVAHAAQATSRALLRWLRAETTEVETLVGREALRALFSVGTRAGVVTIDTAGVAQRLFDLSQTPVSRVMTPNERVVSLPPGEGLDELLRIAASCGFTRIPVRDREGRRYIGAVNVHSALLGKARGTEFHRLIHAAPSVSGDERAAHLLSRLQGTPHRMAFVEGAEGEHIGIVTTEDLIEEILGELP